MSFTTKVLNHKPIKADIHGALRYPQYDSVAFEYKSAEDMEAAFTGRVPSHSYSRITNPTVEVFEQKIASLANAKAVLATSSGMGAISTTILTLAKSGDNIVTTNYLFGNTLSLFNKTLGPWGLETRCIDMQNLSALKNTIDNKTSLIFLESITNPQLQVVDIEAICKIAKSKNIPVVLDGTVTTPYIFNAKDAGVAIEVLSSTKYISGGATSVGGLIIDYGNFSWKYNSKLVELSKKFGPFALLKKMRSEVLRNNGGYMSAYTANLQALGLETLAMRIDKSCFNAMEVAVFLEKQCSVSSVNYPGLKSHDNFNLAQKMFKDKFGGILTFNLKDKEACFVFMDKLNLIKRATNLNDNKSLIIHPASTIYTEFNQQERLEMGVDQGMIRLSVGIEDTQDLIKDLEQALVN